MGNMHDITAICLRPGPLCDWHHHWGHHGGSPDPETDAMVTAVLATVAVLLGSTLLMCVAGGPAILVLTRKARHLFWSIPAANSLVYAIILYLRPYPGGFHAQFRTPGIFYTVIELILVVLVSLGAATVLCIVYLVVRMTRKGVAKLANIGQPQSPAARDQLR